MDMGPTILRLSVGGILRRSESLPRAEPLGYCALAASLGSVGSASTSSFSVGSVDAIVCSNGSEISDNASAPLSSSLAVDFVSGLLGAAAHTPVAISDNSPRSKLEFHFSSAAVIEDVAAVEDFASLDAGRAGLTFANVAAGTR